MMATGVESDDVSFHVTPSLGIFFFVYVAKADPGKGQPRVTVQYRFRLGRQEKAQTQPGLLSATNAQAVASDEIPLESFVPGEDRLSVLPTDEIARPTVERRAGFRVIP
jgi:hypothetical protein